MYVFMHGASWCLYDDTNVVSVGSWDTTLTQAVDVLPIWLVIKDIPQVQCLQSNTASDGPLLRLGCRVALWVAVATFGRAYYTGKIQTFNYRKLTAKKFPP